MRLLSILTIGFMAPACAVEVDCFRSKSPQAAYISVESADLLDVAGDGSSKTATVSLGSPTCVLATKEVNGQAWAYVGGYWFEKPKRTVRGWLPTDLLVYQNRLVRHLNVRAQMVDVNIGDYSAQYTVRSGGAFEVWQVVGEHKCRKNEIPNEYGACEDGTLVRGHLYGKGTFAIAISPKHGESDVFVLRSDGALCPWQLGNMPASCR